MQEANRQIAVIGLGYVGWPLLLSLSKKYSCWGLDTNLNKIQDLKVHESNNLSLTSSWEDIGRCDFYIVAVPTPTNKNNKPDITSLSLVCEELAKVVTHENIIVFESTVYPGATEDICIPIIESLSGLKLNQDFYVGYSPERINVGDKEHQLENTPKIISGSNEKTCLEIKNIYKSIIDSDIIIASSIKTAEAAKMYENVQRDVLIGLANEYSEFCRKMGIDILEVTSCAASKWNFSRVFPGLVGGHCIGVDTYYLLEKVEKLELDMPIVRTARETNEGKVGKILDRMIGELKQRNQNFGDSEVLILGFAYKNDTSDIRNTKIAPIIKELRKLVKSVDCFDPLVDCQSANYMYSIDVLTDRKALKSKYNAVFKLVNHSEFCSFDKTNMIDISTLV